jgi:hypothetical protein
VYGLGSALEAQSWSRRASSYASSKKKKPPITPADLTEYEMLDMANCLSCTSLVLIHLNLPAPHHIKFGPNKDKPPAVARCAGPMSLTLTLNRTPGSGKRKRVCLFRTPIGLLSQCFISRLLQSKTGHSRFSFKPGSLLSFLRLCLPSAPFSGEPCNPAERSVVAIVDTIASLISAHNQLAKSWLPTPASRHHWLMRSILLAQTSL